MHLVYHPEFCITVVSNFSWVLQSSQDELQNNGYPKFWEGKQGTIWSRWKWWMLEAYGIFFTAPTIFLFSLLVAWGRGETLYTDIIEIYGGHEHRLGRALLSLFIHSHWTNISRKKKCELTFGLYRRYALQAFGDSCMSLSNVCNAGWTL